MLNDICIAQVNAARKRVLKAGDDGRLAIITRFGPHGLPKNVKSLSLTF